jgi:hypothetical protein
MLADDPFERLNFTRLVEATEQVVERAVLEHDDDYMVEGVVWARRGHRLDQD